MAIVSLPAKARPLLVGSRLWLGFVGLQILAGLLIYPGIPTLTLPPLVKVVGLGGLGASVGAAVLVGVARYRPAHRAPWLVLAAAMGSFAVAQTLFAVNHLLLDDMSFPAPADGFYLAFYLLVTVALVLFVRRRTPAWDLVGTVDAGIVAVGAGLLSWVFLISPSAQPPMRPGCRCWPGPSPPRTR